MLRTVIVLAAALGVCALAGCNKAARSESRGAALVADPVAPRAVPVLDGKSGQRVAWKDLVGAAADADVVVIGEVHGHPMGQAAAAALFADVLAVREKAALSMEFFERDEQSRLDEYLGGITDEAAFRKRTQRNAGNYPPGHRAMVEAAKSHKRPVIAANAPRPYVHAARVEGYERLAALPPEQRRLFRIPDTLPPSDGHYRTEFDRVMGGGASASHDAGFKAQSLWDWTMAESIVRGLDSGNTPVVHVVGKFHCDFDGGTVLALRAMKPGVKVVVVSFTDEKSNVLRNEDRGRADFVVYTGASGD